jgi:hypothetical protein
MRLPHWILVIALAGIAACGFGLADDSGNSIPANPWPWICADGGMPDTDAGCPH